MLPNWINNSDNYVPPVDGGTFVVKTMKELGKAMSKIKLQKGHEKGKTLPPLFKLILTVLLILIISITMNRLVLLAIGSLFLLYICFWSAKDIASIFKASLIASLIALVLFIPAMIMHPEGIFNNIIVVLKVFLSVGILNVFNHTTQWNHVTQALRKCHVPGLFIFTLDITLKYIVLLGNLINDLLTSLLLRSVGKNNKKYQSIGGIMGVTFLQGTYMSQQMYEAMQCRCFTDDYKGL